VNPLGPQITITQVRAEHSSEITVVDLVTKKSTTYPGGERCGFIVEFENGFKLYHMGDTGLFGDLRLIGEYYKPDLAMIPIGGHFVMDPRVRDPDPLRDVPRPPRHTAGVPGGARPDDDADLPDQPGRHAEVLGGSLRAQAIWERS
jgi:hypothetical protein